MPDVSYEFYTNTWGGVLPETTFNQYLTRAWLVLNCITQGRITKIWSTLNEGSKDAIGMALCALVDDLQLNDASHGKEVSLEIVGQHHVSYFQMTSSRQMQLRNLVQMYLCGLTYQGRPLTYRGIDRRCTC